MSSESIHQELLLIVKKLPARERRESLIKQMDTNVNQGLNCFNCIGHCCTFAYNSMQVTPLEALDAYFYLKELDRINTETLGQIINCIEKYRLDYAIPTHSGREMRRSYTCPFYAPGSKGCHLSKTSKPYGCIAFNPLRKGVSEEGNCESNIPLLEERELGNLKLEKEMNTQIKKILKLHWEKRNLPSALREIILALHSF